VCEPEVCVCRDTAHIFAAGYERQPTPGIRKRSREFRPRDWTAVRCDSRKRFKNQRAVRGVRPTVNTSAEGQIGLDRVPFIMRDRRFSRIQSARDTERQKELREDVANLKTLRGLI